MESTTREISCFTLRSRWGDWSAPRKYLEATMFVAVWLQVVGTSMPCCSNTGWPRSSLMTALRLSQASSSYGCRPGFVKYRRKERPVRATFDALARPSGRGSTGWVDMVGSASNGEKTENVSYASQPRALTGSYLSAAVLTGTLRHCSGHDRPVKKKAQYVVVSSNFPPIYCNRTT